MKKIAAILTLALLSLNSFAQTPDWIWAKCTAVNPLLHPNDIVSDENGNTFTTGFFQAAEISFGSISLASPNPYYDFFVVKRNTNGSAVWAKAVGSYGYDAEGKSIALDADGNCYVAGYFSGPSAIFDSFTLTGTGSKNMFIVKYNPNGTVLWAKAVAVGYYDNSIDLALDATGNCYITGSFSSQTIVFGSTTLNNSSYKNVFTVKYDPNGTVLWAKSASGGSIDYDLSIAVDINGNSYVSGTILTDISFGNIDLVNSMNKGLFFVKYSTNGSLIWAKNDGGNFGQRVTDIAVDADGNTYVTGSYNSSLATFGNVTLNNHDGGYVDDLFVVKRNTAGTVLWAKNVGGNGEDDLATSLDLDESGNCYVTGLFKSQSVNFGGHTLTNSSGTGVVQLFVAKYNPNGSVSWAKSIAGGFYEYSIYNFSFDLTLDGNRNTYLTGSFYGSSLSFGSISITNAGDKSMFLAKLASDGLGINETEKETLTSIYPNPTNGEFTVSLPVTNAEITVSDLLGQEIIKTHTTQKTTTFQLDQNGIYIVSVKTEHGTVSQKLVVSQ